MSTSDDDGPELTAHERRWLARFRRTVGAMPASLQAYVMEGGCIYFCKRGVSANEIAETANLNIRPCAVITDAHDDCNMGEW